MERGNPTLYYGTKQLYFGHVICKFTGGGNHPQEDVLQKRLKKTRVDPKLRFTYCEAHAIILFTSIKFYHLQLYNVRSFKISKTINQ